jgi:hypothetical protein
MVRFLLRGLAQGVGVAIAASKMARRGATLGARCAMNRRTFSGKTLVSHRGGRTSGLPTSKARFSKSCQKLAPPRAILREGGPFGEGGRGAARARLAEVLEVSPE